MEERARLLQKLTRLKALSECKTGNVHETATAAATMTRLMLEYKIETADLDGPLEEGVVEENLSPRPRGRAYPHWQTFLLHSLAEAHDCVGYENRERHRQAQGRPRTRAHLCLMGHREDVAHSRLLFQYCLLEIERLCRSWEPRAAAARKNDFRFGAAVAIVHKVQASRQAVRAQAQGRSSRGLVRLDQRQDSVRQAARSAGIFVQERPSRAVAESAYQSGYQAGLALPLPGQGEKLAAPQS